MTEWIRIIKELAVSCYYVIYLCFDRWINSVFMLFWLAAGIAGIWMGQKGRRMAKDLKKLAVIFFGILYLSIAAYTLSAGSIVSGVYEVVIQTVYYVGMSALAICAGNRLWYRIQAPAEAGRGYEPFYARLKTFLFGIGVVSLVPILMISPYVFARSDDYSFGYHCHLAWEKTHSLIRVIQAAFVMVAEAWTDWQGTYSSVFLMAMHPGVFDEKLYALVPAFFIFTMALSSGFLIKTVVVDCLGADKIRCGSIIAAYTLLILQTVPAIQSAYFWFNGAAHYMISHCVFLCMIACILRIYRKKSTGASFIGGIVAAVYVGGGNYVTVVGTMVIAGALLLAILIYRKWREQYRIGIICLVFFAGAAVNMMAPGNAGKAALTTGGNMSSFQNLFNSFVRAFTVSMSHWLGGWMHWTIFVFLLLCLPVLWYIVKCTDFSFQYPLAVTGFSWCYMAAAFFAPLCTLGGVDIGRFQNILFQQGLLVLLIDLAYLMGWFQRKYKLPREAALMADEKKYIRLLLAASLIMAVFSTLAEPHRYTSVHAAMTLRDPNLQEYAADYWENVEILNSEDKTVTIKPLNNIPEFLLPKDSEIWYMGLRLFYDKDKVIVPGYTE